MQKRKLKELNLLDDFLLGTMMSYPGIGEQFSRIILETILNRKIGRLTVVPQKVYFGKDTDKHGARLDVYLEEKSTDATVYDVEADQNDDSESKVALPRRVRFYHSMIDGKSLKSGESYRMLKDVYVIMIMSYDPFGLNRMVYTVSSKCEEVPQMPYEDGAKTIFLYTWGIEGEPVQELKDLLHYMADTTRKNAVNESLQTIQRMVERVKEDEEVSLEYMKIFEREEMLIMQGRKMEQEKAEQKIREERHKSEQKIQEERHKSEQKIQEERNKAATAQQRVKELERELEKLKKQKMDL